MNQDKFSKFQNSVSDEILEEAQNTTVRKRLPLYIGTAAACLGVAVLGAVLLHGRPAAADTPEVPGNSVGMAMVVNPVTSATKAELEELGYRIELPGQAQDSSYTLINNGDVPMAQARFTMDGTEYTYRALKSPEMTDISGIYNVQEEKLDWLCGDLEMQMCDGDTGSWVSWYIPEDETVWCLSAEGDAKDILQTAGKMAADLGHSLDAAPEGAEDIEIDAFRIDGRTVAQTKFTVDGVRYDYRTAGAELSIIDISEKDNSLYALTDTGSVQYCEAEIYYNEGGEGKILWLDIVPGLTYSLTMDTGASPEALMGMADAVFVPAQGDVG